MSRLAPGLLDHFWQSTVVALLALLILASVGHLVGARVRRGVAGMALLKFALPLGLVWPAAQPVLTTPVLPQWLVLGRIAARPGPSGSSSATLACSLAVEIYLLGAAVGIAAALVRARRAAQLGSALPAAGAAVQALAVDAAAVAGLGRAPIVKRGAAGSSPMTCGVTRPVLVLPPAIEAELGENALRVVLLHECLHLRARDNGWRLLQSLILALAWVHPLAWVLSRRFDLETEMACDEAVLAKGVDCADYFRALAQTARQAIGLLPPSTAAAGTTPLGRRLENLRRSQPAPAAGRRWLTASAISVVGVAVAASGWAGSIARSPLQPANARSPTGSDRPITARETGRNRPLLVTLVPPPDDSGLPLPIFRTAPVYPDKLLAAGISGEVVIDVLIGPDGAVSEPALEAYDHLDFGAAATTALLQWRFRPAQLQGRPVPARQKIRLRFRAADGSTDAVLLARD